MPTKAARTKAKVRNDPLVPIVGPRVDAALRWRGKSQEDAADAAGVSRQAISLIASGKTNKCRKSVRSAIAKLCGRPITARYLGGERDLVLPPLTAMPSGRNADEIMPIDSAGFAADWAHATEVDTTPRYELEGYALGRMLATAPDLFRAHGPEWPHPNVENAARWMVSLPLWREFLFEEQRVHAVNAASHREEASEFARHIAAAMAILLRPWIESGAPLRPRVLRRWTELLDAVQGENILISFARDRGEESLLAIFEMAGSDRRLRDHYERYRGKMLAAGMTEAEIAQRIRRGVSSEDDDEAAL